MDEMAMRRCIERKRDGMELRAQDWRGIVEAFMRETIDEAQMAALCMACLLRGMSFDETCALTSAMVDSGSVISFDPSLGVVVDKHSTGGLGDIVSLVSIPIAAACGVRVAKLAGRALGHTGGTIDKLQAIAGFRVALSLDAFAEQIRRVGCAIAAQTERLVPADKRIYHLRDRTGSVPAMGLIASSIISKKIAGGAHAFVFDVKSGAGALMHDPRDAHELARWLGDISTRFKRKSEIFVTDMNQPLGRYVGTGVEVIEAREFLRGTGDERVRELALAIAAAMAGQAGLDSAERHVERALDDGSAYRKFVEMIAAQGGDVEQFEAMRLGTPLAITAERSGYVHAMDLVQLGNAARDLCVGDCLGGLRVDVRLGDPVDAGQPLLQAYGADRQRAAGLAQAFTVAPAPVPPPVLIYERSISAIR